MTIELGDDSDDETPAEVSKRRRGRPKSTPKFVEFSVARPSSPDLSEIRKALHENVLTGAHPAHLPLRPSELPTFDNYDPPPNSSAESVDSGDEKKYGKTKVWIKYHI